MSQGALQADWQVEGVRQGRQSKAREERRPCLPLSSLQLGLLGPQPPPKPPSPALPCLPGRPCWPLQTSGRSHGAACLWALAPLGESRVGQCQGPSGKHLSLVKAVRLSRGDRLYSPSGTFWAGNRIEELLASGTWLDPAGGAPMAQAHPRSGLWSLMFHPPGCQWGTQPPHPACCLPHTPGFSLPFRD